MKRKIPAVLAAALALAWLAAACGSRPSGEHEPITICRFNNLITEEFADALHEVYPEINLEIVSYAGLNGSGYSQYSLEADDMTDIYISTQPFCKDLQPERLIDLSGYDFVNNYSSFMLNSLDVDGGIYLLPTGYTVAGMWYNKTIMEENGWKVPGSFEELKELIPEIRAAGYRPCANAMNLDGYPFNYFFSLGNTVYFGTQDGTRWKEDFPEGRAAAAGNEGVQAVIDYYGEWVENGIISTEHTAVEDYQRGGDTVFYLCLGLTNYTCEGYDGKTYEFGIMPWLSRDGSNNMLTRNVSRYFGINGHLAEPGNEQKLEDALHVLEFVSGPAGQEAIMASTNAYTFMTPLNGGEMAADSPYQEVADVMYAGRSVQMVFVGWEDLIIPMARDLRAMMEGEIPPDDMAEELDATCALVAEQGVGEVYGTLTQTLTYEETARLCAIALGKAADADCAMVSLNEYHGDNNYNDKGVGWYLWEGRISREKVNMIRTDDYAIVVLTMTGAEIRAMQEAGFDCNGNGNPYEYVLVTRGEIEPEDDTSYRLAIGINELAETMTEGTRLTELPESLRGNGEIVMISADEAIREYIGELGTFGAAEIVWTQ